MCRALALLSLASLVACASITPIAYSPRPERVREPRKEIHSLILANTVQGCVSEPEFTDTMLVVKFVCTGNSSGVGNYVLRLDSVENIELQQSGEWYRVLVKHRQGDDFMWSSKSLGDMERLADAVVAAAAQVEGAAGATGDAPDAAPSSI